jgi:UPF0755 protein
MKKKKKSQPKSYKIFLYIISTLFVLLLTLSIYSYFKLNQNLASKGDIFVQIPSNTSYSGIIKILNKDKIFQPKWLFSILIKSYSLLFSDKYYSGTYRFSSENTNLHVLRALFSGNQLYIVKVTFPEGLNLREFAEIAQKKIGCDSVEFIKVATDKKVLTQFGISAPSAEGYLHPNTYNFYWKQSALDIISRLLQLHNQVWKEKVENQLKNTKLSKHQILTLASIIEAESPLPEERPIISGVYHNRLKMGMKLEADPTVKYLFKEKRSRVLFKDLKIASPYNTYMYPGLPPGPINSPSLSSILAAINPEVNNYIYFVAYGDGSSRHRFAKSAVQHMENVKKFRKARD